MFDGATGGRGPRLLRLRARLPRRGERGGRGRERRRRSPTSSPGPASAAGRRCGCSTGRPAGVLDNFFAYESSFRGGVTVAAGDVNGDGRAEVITGTGVGGGPRVQVFDGATGARDRRLLRLRLERPRRGDGGGRGRARDGRADIVTGAGPGGGPHVEVFDGRTHGVVSSFFAYDPGFPAGSRSMSWRRTGRTRSWSPPARAPTGLYRLFNGATGASGPRLPAVPELHGRDHDRARGRHAAPTRRSATARAGGPAAHLLLRPLLLRRLLLRPYYYLPRRGPGVWASAIYGGGYDYYDYAATITSTTAGTTTSTAGAATSATSRRVLRFGRFL